MRELKVRDWIRVLPRYSVLSIAGSMGMVVCITDYPDYRVIIPKLDPVIPYLLYRYEIMYCHS